MTTAEKDKDNISTKLIRFLSMTKTNVDNSHEMHKIGVDTEFASSIENFVANPLKGIIDNLSNVHSDVKALIDSYAKEYFKAHKELIVKAFTVETNFNLQYYIVLKRDTRQNRDKFFDFLYAYEILGIKEKLPIVINFLPKRVMESSGLQNEIDLN